MRRKDREMTKEYGMEIIDKAQYGVVSIVDNDIPYGVPLSIVRAGDMLYFHSAKEGRKVDLFKDNPKVSIAFVGEVKIPENYTKEELDEIAEDPSKAKVLISNVFTTEFHSVIVRGKVKVLEDEDEKIEAMKMICKKYTPTKMEYFNMAIKAGLNRTNLYSVKIEELTAKRKKYDLEGKEMKWGRTE